MKKIFLLTIYFIFTSHITLSNDSLSHNITNRELVNIKAKKIEGKLKKDFSAFGDVLLEYEDLKIYAEYIKYLYNPNVIISDTKFNFFHPDYNIKGDSLYFDILKKTGNIVSPEFNFYETNARGSATYLDIDNQDKFYISNAKYTTCNPEKDDWYLKVDDLHLDIKKDLGIAKKAKIIFKGIPLLYSPYLDFSISGNRKSGFLPPSVGQTAKSGTEFNVPFYFNLAPNYDLTITPRFLSKRGVLLNNEYRFATNKSIGQLKTEFLDNDNLYGEMRWASSLNYLHNFDNGFTGTLDFERVSDNDYFTDLSDNISFTSQTNLSKLFKIEYNGGWWNGTAQVQSFQTLQDELLPVTPPYERIPQLSVLGSTPVFKGLNFEVRGELVDFQHPSLVSGRRDMLYPSISLPIENTFFNIKPKIGYHYTAYSIDSSLDNLIRRVPIYSLDTSLIFDRKLNNYSFYQTLEPRLYYVKIPYRDQSDIPIFDSAESDFNLAQIFTENLFTGQDRINDVNQLTAAVSSRIYSSLNGFDIFKFIIAQRFYFEDQNVTLDLSDSYTRTSNRSDILAGFSGNLIERMSLDLITQYNIEENRWERTNFFLRYKKDNKIFNTSYRFTRNSLEQIDFSSSWFIAQNWTVLSRWNYSTRDKQIIEFLAGLEYNSECWASRIIAHRFASATNEFSTSLFLQLELTGLSKLGVNPKNLLLDNISGY